MKSQRKQVEKELWNWLSLYIRKRDNYTCIVCHKTNDTTTIQAGHLIPRASSLAVKYDEDNICAQCISCNGLHRFNQAPYTQAYIQKYGKDKYMKLVTKSRKIIKQTTVELKELCETYKNKYSKLIK